MQVATIKFDPFNAMSDEEAQQRILAAREKLGKHAVILAHHYQRTLIVVRQNDGVFAQFFARCKNALLRFFVRHGVERIKLNGGNLHDELVSQYYVCTLF